MLEDSQNVKGLISYVKKIFFFKKKGEKKFILSTMESQWSFSEECDEIRSVF